MSALHGCEFLLLAAAAGLAGSSASDPGASETLQIQAREVWTAAGQRLANGVVVISEGKIVAVGGADSADAGQPLLRHDGVLTAGLIACRAASGTRGELQDDTRSILAEARAAAAVDAESRELERLLAAGITAAVVAPGPENLVGGLACVVKTTGRVLEDQAFLALSLSSAALGRSTGQGGFLFGSAEDEAAVASAPELADAATQREGGPETSARTQRGTRAPTSYSGALALLAERFEDGAGPFGRARAGELPVSIEAWERHEVLRAAHFAAEQRLTGSIRGAPLAGDPAVLEALKASGLGVVVGPYAPDQARRSLESVQKLAEAGIPVAFALEAPARAAEELRLTAVRARAAGASRDVLWKALTEDAARLAGVGERIGRLAEGQEADLVLWSGDPLDLSSRVVAVYVDGARAWPRAGAHAPHPAHEPRTPHGPRGKRR